MSKGFKSGERAGNAVGPSCSVYCSGNTYKIPKLQEENVVEHHHV